MVSLYREVSPHRPQSFPFSPLFLYNHYFFTYRKEDCVLNLPLFLKFFFFFLQEWLDLYLMLSPLSVEKSEKMNWRVYHFLIFESSHLTLDFISYTDSIILCIFSLQFGIAKGKTWIWKVMNVGERLLE